MSAVNSFLLSSWKLCEIKEFYSAAACFFPSSRFDVCPKTEVGFSQKSFSSLVKREKIWKKSMIQRAFSCSDAETIGTSCILCSGLCSLSLSSRITLSCSCHVRHVHVVIVNEKMGVAGGGSARRLTVCSKVNKKKHARSWNMSPTCRGKKKNERKFYEG